MLPKHSSANYAEIGYNGDLSVKSLLRVKSAFVVQAERGNDYASIGIGAGYTVKYYRFYALLNETRKNNLNIELKLGYYDNGMPYHIGVSQNIRTHEFDYKAGVGYPITEKTSVMINYANEQFFVGIRQFFK